MMFDPTRDAGLDRLAAFGPKMGRDYASKRNYDRPGHDEVSRLSPYLRYRMVTEDEVLQEALARHSPSAAEKFVQEVYWRTYWKGWLEMRPSVWTSYCAEVTAGLNRVQTEAGLRADWEAACRGETGIDAFDHWAKELADTGYLHNHARMWFASIWIYTLNLPWALGADFFMRHLLDGDPASNTLGWRWVGGMQTVGKTYLARAENIAKYTEGRFCPRDLAPFAPPLDGFPNPERSPLPAPDPLPTGKIALLLTEDDLCPDWLMALVKPASIAIFDGTSHRSPLHVSNNVTAFVSGAIDDLEDRIGPVTRLETVEAVDAWASNFDGVVMPHPPIGGTAQALSALKTPVSRQIRDYDQRAWPHATAGFFKFKKAIPKMLRAYDDQLTLI